MQNWITIALNGLLVIVGAWAFIEYKLRMINERKDAAIMLVLQIDDIRKNVISIKQALDGSVLLEEQMFETNKVISDNIWERKKHLLIKKIGFHSASSLNSFFQCVQNISIHQANIQSFSLQALINNTYIYQGQYAGIYLQHMQPKNQEAATSKSEMDDKVSDSDKSVTSIAHIKSVSDKAAQSCLAPRPYIPTQFISTISKHLSEYDGLSIDFAYTKLKNIAKIK